MLTDARGVPITAGDTVVYGFGVGRSVAMAEGRVLAEKEGYPYPAQTPSGRIKIRVIRRSYASGEKPVVDVAADRLVVLKDLPGVFGSPYLPESPLPTQDERARKDIEQSMERHKEDLRSEVITWGKSSFADLAEFHAYAAKQLAKLRRKLEALDAD